MPKETIVVNIYRYDYYGDKLEYRNMPDGYVNIMRPSLFGNPFKLKDDFNGDRKACLEAYERYFKRMIRKKWFRNYVMKLRGKILVCCCAPMPCHGDIIAAYVNSHEG